MSVLRTAVAVLLVALPWASGCASSAVSLSEGPRSFTETDYDRVYKRWTRSQDDFAWSRMADVLHVTATFESWEFRWAYVVRYAHDYSFDANERDEMLRASLADSQGRHRFFVTLAGQRIRENDLTGRLSAWRVVLVDAQGHQIEPLEIERVRRPTPAEQVYFPSVNPHRMVFRIVFPARLGDGRPSIPEGSSKVRLRFTGARGTVDLTWDLAPARTVAPTSGSSASVEAVTEAAP
ncbi:MAG: hypothetical protein U0230_18680 [Polyangiales bacterium]